MTQQTHCRYFDTTRKGNHSTILTPTVVDGRRPFRLKFALNVTQPFEKRQLRQISADNVSTVRDSERSSIMMHIGSRPRAFQRAIDGVCMLPLSPPKGGSTSDFSVFNKTFDRV